MNHNENNIVLEKNGEKLFLSVSSSSTVVKLRRPTLREREGRIAMYIYNYLIKKEKERERENKVIKTPRKQRVRYSND